MPEMYDLVWMDPPPPRVGHRQWVEDQLKANPGRWAMVAQDTNALGVGWYTPLIADSDYEVVIPKKSSSSFDPRDVYVRYRGK